MGGGAARAAAYGSHENATLAIRPENRENRDLRTRLVAVHGQECDHSTLVPALGTGDGMRAAWEDAAGRGRSAAVVPKTRFWRNRDKCISYGVRCSVTVSKRSDGCFAPRGISHYPHEAPGAIWTTEELIVDMPVIILTRHRSVLPTPRAAPCFRPIWYPR